LFRHLSIKSKTKTVTEGKGMTDSKPSPSKKRELLSPDMSDEEIEEAVRKDLKSVSSRHSWLDLPDILGSGDMDSPEDRLLTTLIDQSNILIRQNELILRILRRGFPPLARYDRTAITEVNTHQ